MPTSRPLRRPRRPLTVEVLESRLAPATLTTFEFNIPAHVARLGVQLALFGAVPPATQGDPPTQMKYLVETAGSYSYSLVPTVAQGSTSPLTLLTLSPPSSTTSPVSVSIPLPDDTLQAGAAVLFVGDNAGIPITFNGSYTTGVVAVPTVSTNPNDKFTLFELTNFEVTPGQFSLDVDISEVDQVGFPYTVTSSNNAPYPLSEVGISVARSTLFDRYQSTFAQTNTEFLESLTLGQNSQNDQLRLIAPQTLLGTLQKDGPMLISAQQGSNGNGGLLPGTAYYYVVTAVSATGETTASTTRAYASTIVNNTTSVTLNWQPYTGIQNGSTFITGSSHTTGYKVYRGVGQAPDGMGAHPPPLDQFKLVGTANGASTTSFQDVGYAPTAQTPPTNNYGFSPLSTYFTQEIQDFFHYYRSNDFVLNQAPQQSGSMVGTTWKGRTMDFVPNWPAPYTTTQTYTALVLTGQPGGEAAGKVVRIYQPLFSTNTNLRPSALVPYLPPMPAWMSPDVRETPSQMIFGCDGAFATNATDPNVLNDPNAGLLKLAIGNIENVIVSGFNRGLTTLSPNFQPNQWVNPVQFAQDPTPGTGGSLQANQSYFYVITTLDAAGNETVPTREVKASLGDHQNAVTLNWLPVDPSVASSYNIYRGNSSGAQTLIANVPWATPGPGGTQSFSDTGSSFVSATAPPWTFYSPGSTSNLYAKFLHRNSTTDPANGISFNGLVYGYPFDDQGNFSTNIQYPTGQLPTTITFQINPFDPGQLLKLQTPATVAAGTPYTVTVKAETGTTVRFWGTDGQADLPANYTFLPGDQGTKTFSVTFKTAGTQSLEVVDVARGSVTSSSAVRVTPGAPDHISFGQPRTFGFLNTPLPAVTVLVLDAFGNRVSGTQSVHIALLTSPAGATLSGRTTVSAVNGLATFANLSLNRAGAYTLEATSGALPSVFSDTITVSPTTRFTLQAPATARAGDTVTITVNALDAAGRLDPLYRGTVRFLSDDPQATLPADYTFTAADAGRHSFTVKLGTAGLRYLFVSDSLKGTVRGLKYVQVTPGAATGFRVTGFPPFTHGGIPGSFTVTATDAFGNRATSYQGVVQFSSSDGAATLPATANFTAANAGSRTFSATLRTVGVQTLTATAGGLTPLTGSQSGIQVYRLAASIEGPAAAVPGEPLTFALGAVAGMAPASTRFSYYINWGDGSPVQAILNRSAAILASHVFSTIGTRTVQVTAVDTVGRRSVATQMVAISRTRLGADPADTGLTALFVGGTAGNDSIVLTPANLAGTDVTATLNGVGLGTFTPTGRVYVYGDAGNDTLALQTAVIGGNPVSLAVPAILNGGLGNDRLDARGSATANVLLGSAGNDTLMGGGGRDVLIGGVGADVLQAGVGASLLIADQTTYDGNPLALARLAEEWNSPLLYLARVSNLSGLSIGANTPFALTRETVRSDASVDLLFGAAGLDWFLLTGRGPAIDWFGGFAVGEEVTWL